MIPAHQYRWAAPLLDRYNLHLLRKSFARIRVANLGALRGERSLIVTPNHSCWWDGCVDLYLSRQVLRRRSFLMMGETELAKHRAFSSLGVFSPGLHYIVRELQRQPALLWIYPQGEMLPARAPVVAKPGALFISEETGVDVVPMGQRYEFLRDDHPDILVRVGDPITGLRRGEETRLSEAMSSLLTQIDQDVAEMKLEDYEVVLSGAESRNVRLERLRAGKTR